jgi:uncharacterized protein (TIGR00266 family)
MAFCTSCGASLAEGVVFCSSCGARAGQAAGATSAATASAPAAPLEYTVEGDNLQIARIKLRPGQELYAEAGKMVYKTANVEWQTRMSGETLGQKFMGVLRRTVTGESLFLTYFRTLNGAGEVGFAGDYPGKLYPIALGPGQIFLVQRDSFICAETTVQFGIQFTRRLGTGLFGGEGFILEKFTGPGVVFIHAGGDFVHFDLGAGELLQVDTGCIVGFEEGVNYDIQLAGGIKTAIFGGEGLFLATLRGPGKVIVQTMTLSKLRRELGGGRTGGDERSGLGAITNLFGSED